MRPIPVNVEPAPGGHNVATLDDGEDPVEDDPPEPSLVPSDHGDSQTDVKEEAIDSLPESVRRTRLPKGKRIRDVSPLLYKARKQVVRRLPEWATQALANVAKRIPR